jgi:membrane fusion protein, copper/silver efflux system
MRRLSAVTFLALGLTAGAAGGYWYAQRPPAAVAPPAATNIAAAADRMALYYRDPSGAPYWSATPKKDKQGRDYLPVFEDEEPAFGPGGEIKKASRVTVGPRKILYYRNPMGLPDTSPVPKKDWMGMDYIPVYEGEEPDDGKTVRVSVEKVQRSGVRTEVIEARTIIRPVRAVGTVMHDESRLTIVTMRSDGYIEELFVDKGGQHVHAGEPLFRVYSPDIVSAQVNLRNGGGLGGEQRLRNFSVPESHVRDVLAGKNPMSLIWPSPASGM